MREIEIKEQKIIFEFVELIKSVHEELNTTSNNFIKDINHYYKIIDNELIFNNGNNFDDFIKYLKSIKDRFDFYNSF